MLIGVWQRAERKKKVQAGNSKIPRKMETQISETRRAERSGDGRGVCGGVCE